MTRKADIDSAYDHTAADTEACGVSVSAAFTEAVGNALEGLGEDDTLLAGVSGGADSVALLLALVRLGRRVAAVHCDFHLRGDESERDRVFTEKLCARLRVPLTVLHFDVDAYRRDHRGTSVEMACRELRYTEFRRMMAEDGHARIAVAHNADDNVETVLLNLFRGSGIRGLSGMPVDNGTVIRPLLGQTRAEIEQYLSAEKQDYIVDSSNRSDIYRRNFIRLRVLPLIESQWPGARKAILRTAANLRSDLGLLGHLTDSNISTTGDSLLLSRQNIADSPMPETLIYHFASEHGFNVRQAEEMARCIADGAAPGRHWQSGTAEVHLERDGLHLYHTTSIPQHTGLGHILPTDEVAEVDILTADTDTLGEMRLSGNDILYLPQPPGDYGFRPAQTGDRISPLGMRGTTLVSKIMKDAHLTAMQRRRMLLLVHKGTGEIVWIPGLKRSRHHIVAPGAAVIYRLRLR